MKVALCLWTFVAISAALRAQEPIAPTPETVGNPRGDEWDGYNISDSFEFGERFLGLGGDDANYRSAVNYGNGPRLLSTTFSLFSKTGEKKLFDSILLSTQGLGGDPYESVSLRIRQHKFYSYVGTWRSTDYVNPGLVTDGGEGTNALNTNYTFQSHDLTLMPESHLRWLLGYSRDSQSGLGYTTELVPNETEDLFPVVSNIHRVRNDYRTGVEWHWRNSMVKLVRTWSDYKDDSTYGLPSGSATEAVTDFARSAPAHQTDPSWTLLLVQREKRVDINGSFTYANGKGAYVSDEAIFGGGFLATPLQQIQTSGEGHQPIATGNLNVDVDATASLTVTSHTSFYDQRNSGTNAYFEQDAPGAESEVLYFQALNIRTWATDVQADQKVTKWLDVFGGYDYSNRLIFSVQDVAFGGVVSDVPFSQTNEQNDGFFGLRIRPIKGLTMRFEGEASHSSLPFTPKSDGNYTAWKASVSYKAKNLQLSASAQNERNATAASLTSFSTRTQTWSASASWNARSWLSLDASYSNIYTDVLGGLAFFADGSLVNDAVSYYIMNLHSATAGIRMQLRRSISVYAGGTAVRDSGDGRPQADASQVDMGLTPFQVAQTFPLTYYSPFARLSIRLSSRTRWNIGYQMYKYQADFSPLLNFTANTGFTSLLWTF
jgi:hypothetical protein